jgi:hypothetical protein
MTTIYTASKYLTAAALCLSACVSDMEMTTEVEQELFQQTGYRFWNEPRVDGFGTSWSANTIPICFETGLAEDGTGFNGNSSLVPNFATYKAWFQEAIEESWGRVANLRFVGYGQCAERFSWLLSGWVTIYWGDWYQSVGGYRTDKWTRMSLARPNVSGQSKADFQKFVRHEMGHALGFAHEKDRPDKPAMWGTGGLCGYSVQTGTGWTEVYDAASIMNFSYCNEAAAGVLTPYDIYGVQRVYGRKPARSIVGLGGRCVNTPGFNYTNGTLLQIYDCYGQSNDTWQRSVVSGYQVLGQLSSPYTASVLSARSPRQTWGTWAEVQSYSGINTNNVWKLDGMQWRAIGNTCVTVRADNRLVIATCDPNDLRQRWDWDYGVQGRFRNVATGTCANVANASNATHTPINVYPCGNPNPHWNEVFTTTTRGEIKWGNQCLNVANYYPVPGAELQLYPCAPAGTATKDLYYNELFHLSGPITHGWYGDALSVYGGLSANGTPLHTWVRQPGVSNQDWDIYF